MEQKFPKDLFPKIYNIAFVDKQFKSLLSKYNNELLKSEKYPPTEKFTLKAIPNIEDSIPVVQNFAITYHTKRDSHDSNYAYARELYLPRIFLLQKTPPLNSELYV